MAAEQAQSEQLSLGQFWNWLARKTEESALTEWGSTTGHRSWWFERIKRHLKN